MKTKIFLILIFMNFIASYSQVAITEIYLDTPYSEYFDRGTPHAPHHLGEYIELYNYTTEDIPLKGWSITDHVSAYYFPDDAIIHSESFILVAYRDLFNGPDTGNYFPEFFPTTVGKEAQIFYQDRLILRNNIEDLHINMGEIRSIYFDSYPIFSTQYSYSMPESNYNDQIQSYYITSRHLGADSAYYHAEASPLSAEYLPPTQNVEDIAAFQQAVIENTANITWSYYADLLLNAQCPLVINEIEQTPWETYLEQGKCFYYDASGNYKLSVDCYEEEDDDAPINTQYTAAQLEEIESQIYVAPNPTTNQANISWEEAVNGKITSIQIVNTAGVSIGAPFLAQNTSTSAVFYLSGQPAGIYIVSFTLNTGQVVSKNLLKI